MKEITCSRGWRKYNNGENRGNGSVARGEGQEGRCMLEGG